jgi:hypothetical protein
LYRKSVSDVNEIVFNRLDKFSAINFKKLFDFPNNRHIEIRSPGGQDYHKKGDEIEATIRKAVRALEIASDPNAYRQEYLKMLYKLVPPKKEVKDYAIDKFAKSVGQWGRQDIAEIIDAYIDENGFDSDPKELNDATTSELLRVIKSPSERHYIDFNRWAMIRSDMAAENSPLQNAKIVKFLDAALERIKGGN